MHEGCDVSQGIGRPVLVWIPMALAVEVKLPLQLADQIDELTARQFGGMTEHCRVLSLEKFSSHEKEERRLIPGKDRTALGAQNCVLDFESMDQLIDESDWPGSRTGLSTNSLIAPSLPDRQGTSHVRYPEINFAAAIVGHAFDEYSLVFERTQLPSTTATTRGQTKSTHTTITAADVPTVFFLRVDSDRAVSTGRAANHVKGDGGGISSNLRL